MEDNVLTIFNENGTMKSKEQFTEEIIQIYDEMVSEEKKNRNSEEDGLISQITNPMNGIDVENSLDTFNFCKRTIYINNTIVPETANMVLEEIRLWNTADEVDNIPVDMRIPIKIYINTLGGDLTATLSIIDTIKMSKTPVYTINSGSAYSGGFFILIAGHKRFGFENASYLYHQGFSEYGADAHKFSQYTEHYKETLNILKNIVLDNTKISPELYKEKEKDDWYLTTEQALNYGIIDEICSELL